MAGPQLWTSWTAYPHVVSDLELINDAIDDLYDLATARNPIEKWVQPTDPGYATLWGTDSFDYTPAVERAIAAMPRHPYTVGQPYVPTGSVLDFDAGKYIVNDVEMPEGFTVRGRGYGSTFLYRNANNPIFWCAGVGYGGGATAGHPSINNIRIEGVTLASVGDFAAPLLSLEGCANAVVAWVRTIADTCTHIFLNQVYDSRFFQTMHAGGGTAGGLPVIEIMGGGAGYKVPATQYKQCMELQFDHMWFESYVGPTIRATRREDGASKVAAVNLTNFKMEAAAAYTGVHMLLEIQNLFIDQVYFTVTGAAGDVVQMNNCRGVSGVLRFGFVAGATAGTSMLHMDANCYIVDLDVIVVEPQPAGANVLTLDAPNESRNDIRVFGTEQLVNGTNTYTRTNRVSRIVQTVGSSTTTAEQSISRIGRVEWKWGNPSNPAGSDEEFYFYAASTKFLTYRSKGADPAASVREIAYNADLLMGSAWNDPALLRLGTFRFWVDATGAARFKNGVPASDTDGLPLALSTTNSLTSGEETMPRLALAAAPTMTSGVLRLTYFTATKSETINNIRVSSAGTAAGATPTLVRFGLYTVDAAGALALVASTANDTSLLAAVNTQYIKALQAGYAKVAGQRYAVGALVVTGAAAPTIAGNVSVAAASALFSAAPRLAAFLGSQTDLPSSATDASLSATVALVYAALTP